MATSILSWLLTTVCICGVYGGSVNTTHQSVLEGGSVDITCSYTLEGSEVVDYLYIDTYVRGSGFRDLARFYPNGTALYAPYGATMRNRTSLRHGDSSVTLRIDPVRCSDEGEYYCNLQTNDTYEYMHMDVLVKGPSSKPSIMLGKEAGCFEEGQMVEAACVSLVGSDTASFVWHALRLDNSSEEVTELADPGPLYRVHPDTCGYKRVSHITFNATAADEGMTLRCSVVDRNDVTGDDVTSPPIAEDCGELCAETNAFYFKRHPEKPTITSVRTTFCPDDSIMVGCYGDVGDHTGRFHWFKHVPGQDPVNVTSQADTGSPYKRHNSCNYERASLVLIPADSVESGVVIRCVLHSDEDGISATPSGECGHHCAETEPLTIEESCKKPGQDDDAPPKPNEPPKSGTTTLSVSTFLVACSFLLL